MPHHVDIHVGKNVRTRRRQMDMTQKISQICLASVFSKSKNMNGEQIGSAPAVFGKFQKF